MKKSELKELYGMMFPDYPDIVTVRQLQKMLGISRPLAYDLINSGEVQAVKIGNSFKIPKVSVINYVTDDRKELYAEIMKHRTNKCAVCGTEFAPNSNRQKYCTACSRIVHQKQKNESARRRRTDD